MSRTVRLSKTSGELGDAAASSLAQLFRAVAAGDATRVSRLLRESPALARSAIDRGASRADARDWFVADAGRYIVAGDTALHFAAAAYRVALCKRLLAAGADVRAANRRRAEPLHAACAGQPGSRLWNPERQAATIELLIDAGADPNCVDAESATPLHRAVRTRCAEVVRVLLERGADARARNASGSTPLHLAVQATGRGGSGSPGARAQQASIVDLLMTHGARASDEDGHGTTVGEIARRSSISFIAQLAT